MQRRLYIKFLLVLVPLFLVFEVPGQYLLIRYEARDDSEALAARIGSQAARVAGAITRHVSRFDVQFDVALARDFLSTLAVDPAFLCAEVHAATPDRVLVAAPQQIGCTGQETGLRLELPIGTDNAQSLVVRFTDAEIHTHQQLRQTLVMLVIALGALVAAVAASFGFHLVVSRPLGRMLAAIRHNSETGERTPIAVSQHDELGTVTAAFNDMLRHEFDREQALIESNKALSASREEYRILSEGLETRVDLRTAELADREMALASSERRFRDFAVASSDWYWEMDENLRFSYFSDRFTEVTGVKPAVLLGKTREETGVPGVAPQEWKDHLDALHGKRPFRNFIHSRVKSDGSTVWLSINGVPYFDQLDNFKGFRGTGSDITKNRDAEIALQDAKNDLETRVKERTAELQRSETRLRDAIEAMSEGFALYDADERLVMCNEPYRRTLPKTASRGLLTAGTKLEEMVQDGIENGFIPSAYKDGQDYLASRLEAFRNPSGPFEFETTNGHWVRVDERKTSDGGTVAIRADITERKQTEEQLYQAQKMEAVGQLTGGVAHDFNNLLGVIIGNLGFLQEKVGEDQDYQELLATAEQAALQGAELTSRLLAFSRKQPLRPTVVNLNDLVEGMIDLLKRTLGEMINIRTMSAPDLKAVEIDPGQFETALVNLAVNARHAMPDGGRLTLETENVELDQTYTERHAGLEPGPYVMLVVTDSGVGMSPLVLEQAFDPFFTTRQVGEGSGLGLSMVHGFVKQSGGHVSVYSEEGEGTAFKLYFRATEAELTRALQPQENQTFPRGAGEAVLIVEDDERLRKIAIRVVSGLGYKVEAVPDGPSALALLDNGAKVDVLFTDVVLPNGINGFTLAAAARARRPDLQVLYTSGYSANSIIHNGGINEDIDLLNKPYRRLEVARRLRKSLERKSQENSD